ncbi:MAG: cadherin-like beta sandwich domain-containing protein [Clostridia bacterium]|nr:cadherin-like beta sandwich domain-containing protein [Clostridia bacterium]
MKKLLKSVISVCIVIALLSATFAITAFAADTSVIKLSSSKVNVGDTVKVTVSFNSEYEVVTSQATLSYDSSVLKFVSSTDKYSGGSGTLKFAHVGNEQTFEFKAIKAGNCTLKTYDCMVSDGNAEYTVSGTSTTLSVVDKTLSSNANLKSLTVSAGSLTPAFSKNVTTYNITIGPDVKTLTVGAKPEDSDAKVDVEGSKTMKTGENTRVVVVTAPNGTTKRYTLNITKLEKESVSSNNTSSSTEQPVIKPELAVDGEMLYVADVDKDTKVEGFTLGDYTFKGTVVKALINEQSGITLLNLIDINNFTRGLFVYDATTDTAQKFEFVINQANMYILVDKPESIALPLGFKESVAQIDGAETVVYITESNQEIYLVYAKFGDSEPDFYLYDTVEKTLQRYFGGLTTTQTQAPTQSAQDDKNAIDQILENKNYRFILIGFALVIGIVVLILIIVILVKSSKIDDDDDNDNEDSESDESLDL